MSRYRELVKKAMDKGEEEELWDIGDKMAEKLKKKHPEMYDEFMQELECLAYKIPVEEAEEIVRDMRPKGQYWTMSQVKEIIKSEGINTDDLVNWYLVMNMVYNDYCDTAKAYGLQGDEKFFFSLAKDFIDDPDAKPFKVEKYFCD